MCWVAGGGANVRRSGKVDEASGTGRPPTRPDGPQIGGRQIGGTVETPRTEDEVDEVMNKIAEIMDSVGTKWKGMSYEQGVRAAIEWLFEDGPDPLED